MFKDFDQLMDLLNKFLVILPLSFASPLLKHAHPLAEIRQSQYTAYSNTGATATLMECFSFNAIGN